MKIIVLDTETIGLQKPFIYDLGYIVYDTDHHAKIKEKDYIISNIWKNRPLIETAYYYNKKPLYIERLKSGYSKMISWGNACRFLANDIKRYNVEKVFAYNSRFDYNAFAKTCALFNRVNPLEKVEVCDIMNEIKEITNSTDYKEFCKKNALLTKHKKPRSQRKAETLYKYLTKNVEYKEEHTALEDSKIELFILLTALGLI